MTSRSHIAARTSLRLALVSVAVTGAMACARAPEPRPVPSAITVDSGRNAEYVVRDSVLPGSRELSGIAAPVRQATLSTRLMGTVMSVLVQEGEQVSEGQPLLSIDTRDLQAKEAQANAALAEAEVVQQSAAANARRFRALFTDSAASRVQLEAAETALARADAAVRTAGAVVSELRAVTTYGTVKAPFGGVITRRHVDPGAFASPGAPLLTMEDPSRLRIAVTTAPDAIGTLRQGATIRGTIEHQPVQAVVEGIVSSGGGMYVVNALVANRAGRLLSGGAATLAVPTASRRVVLVPIDLIQREGDLAGVVIRTGSGDIRRWIRLGVRADSLVEVTSGLEAGDRIVVASRDRAGV